MFGFYSACLPGAPTNYSKSSAHTFLNGFRVSSQMKSRFLSPTPKTHYQFEKVHICGVISEFNLTKTLKNSDVMCVLLLNTYRGGKTVIKALVDVHCYCMTCTHIWLALVVSHFAESVLRCSWIILKKQMLFLIAH